jgi:hypothetical protein
MADCVCNFSSISRSLLIALGAGEEEDSEEFPHLKR